MNFVENTQINLIGKPMSLKNNCFQLKASISYAIEALNKQKVIAYPTESVFGVGCDPDSKTAVNHILKIKKRPIEKGFILIAADLKQLKPYIDDSSLTLSQWNIIFSNWPGPVTFVFPAKISTPYWLTGHFNSLAVRITNHPILIKLCRMFGKPLISTSANITGLPSCRTKHEVYSQFGNEFLVVDGKTSGLMNPSEIRDALTGECFRKG